MKNRTVGAFIAGIATATLVVIVTSAGAIGYNNAKANQAGVNAQVALPYKTPGPNASRGGFVSAKSTVTTCTTVIGDHRLGYYLTGNADVTADAAVIGNLEGLTQYRSLADGSTFPGWNKAWINNLGPEVKRNYVLELKHYGAAAGPQTVGGVVVPAPNMTIQQRPGTTWPKAYGYDQVTSGAIDPLLDRALDQLKVMPYNNTVNIQLASEFDTDHEFGTTEAGVTYTWTQSDARAIQALKYITDYFDANGLPEGVTLSIGMGGFDRAAFKRMHPADIEDRFQVLQWNAYNHGTNRTPLQVFSRTWDWAVEDLKGTYWLNKPIMIAEWGIASSLGSQAAWIDGVDEAITELNERPGPDISDANYFNANPAWATLNPKQSGLEALGRVANSAPFND